MLKKTMYSISAVATVFIVTVSVINFINPALPRSGATAEDLVLDEQEATVRAIKAVNPAVVNIEVFDYDNVVVVDPSKEVQEVKREKVSKGGGSGFLVSADGYIITNRHVINKVAGDTGEYQVTLSSGKKYYAQLIDRDPLKDLAIIKIFDKNLPFVKLGDSNKLEVGMSVIAIGNSLGKYQNSATKGIVSGLGRFLFSDVGSAQEEHLDNVIQSDAEINLGNSGGPLINLKGEVVGVNVAMDTAGKSIGFAIPIVDAEPVIRTVIKNGRIIRPRLGVRYRMLTPELAEENKLGRATGAWLSTTDPAIPVIVTGSPAEKAGLKAGDIIYELNAIPLDEKNNLLALVQRYKPGDRIGFKVLRGSDIMTVIVVLDEFKLGE